MRIFKVTEPRLNGLPSIEITYHGFNHKVNELTMVVALVQIEDTIESWAIESMDYDCVSEFIAFLANRDEESMFLGFFHKFVPTGC